MSMHVRLLTMYRPSTLTLILIKFNALLQPHSLEKRGLRSTK